MNINTLSKSLVLLGLLGLGSLPSYAQKLPLYIGTYTSGSQSEGVYLYNFNQKNGEATFQQSIAMSNPSFLARNGHILYAVNEDTEGKVTAYNLKTNQILSQMDTGGAHPCHIAYSTAFPILLVSNYSGGSLSMYSLEKDGAIRRLEQHIQFTSSSVDKQRQDAAHIHSAFFSKNGKRAYVSDLGADLIYEYGIEKHDDTYTLKELSCIEVKKGGGPRHLTFTKDENVLYSVLELTGEIEVLRKVGGNWESHQVIPIYDNYFEGEQGAADIKISQDGKYVYATNRGAANVIVTYEVLKDGKLKQVQVLPVGGISPRNLNLSPNNKWLFVGNQESQQVSIFEINRDGSLHKSSHEIKVPKPVCVIF